MVTQTEIIVKLFDLSYADTGNSLVNKKSFEKKELCQRLREQLNALEKETASRLSEMDTFNNQLKVYAFCKYIVFSSKQCFPPHPVTKLLFAVPLCCPFSESLCHFYNIKISIDRFLANVQLETNLKLSVM